MHRPSLSPRKHAAKARSIWPPVIVAIAAGCTPEGSGDGEDGAEVDTVAVAHVLLEDADRPLAVTVFYPSSSPATGLELAALVPDEANAERLAMLISDAPADCPGGPFDVAIDGSPSPSAQPRPLVVISHCHGCLGISHAGLAIALAHAGWVVAAPDHAGDTLFDDLAGSLAPLDDEFLQIRSADLERVIDAAVASDGAIGVRIEQYVDPARVALIGHSFGAATIGLTLGRRDELIAGVAIAAPVASPLFPSVDLTLIDDPIAMFLATEDNSITEFGNNLIRSNAELLGASLTEVTDAGHWSFSELCGLHTFAAGCGEGERQTAPGEAFTYADPDTVRAESAGAIVAFLAQHGGGLDPDSP